MSKPRRFGSYWTQTETFEALRRHVDLDLDGLHAKVVELVGGGRMPVNMGTFRGTGAEQGGNDILCGIAYDPRSKERSCAIERGQGRTGFVLRRARGVRGVVPSIDLRAPGMPWRSGSPCPQTQRTRRRPSRPRPPQPRPSAALGAPRSQPHRPAPAGLASPAAPARDPQSPCHRKAPEAGFFRHRAA